jgi:hypothetical protein
MKSKSIHLFYPCKPFYPLVFRFAHDGEAGTDRAPAGSAMAAAGEQESPHIDHFTIRSQTNFPFSYHEFN